MATWPVRREVVDETCIALRGARCRRRQHRTLPETKDGATIYRRGKEILIGRPGSTGTYFKKASAEDAMEYVGDFIQAGGGLVP